MRKKYALIVGASGGIGQAICHRLAAQGYNLYLHYNRNEASMATLMERLKIYDGEFFPIQADLSKENGYKVLSEQILSVDEIVYCSGNSTYGLLTDLKDGEAHDLINVHVISPLLLIRDLLPKLLSKREGNIIIVSSIWGQTGASCEVAYSTAKGAQISFVKALSKEVALNGLRVNAIAPGAIKTSMMDRFNEEELHMLKEEIPMGRIGLPEDIAGMVSFLLSDQASYITGQVLAVNGGWYI